MTSPQPFNTNDKIAFEMEIRHLAIEDDTPVDNFQSEKQQRLLVEPLYSSQVLSPPFIAAANVGLFYEINIDPIVPDAFLSLGVQVADDLSLKQDRSYFVRKFGKAPEVCIEVVSNREGNELTLSRKARRSGNQVCKKDIYARIPITYYVVFDPFQQIQNEFNMNNALLRVWKFSAGRYTELTPPVGIIEAGQSVLLEEVGLGLTLWSGEFEGLTDIWLRWCEQDGVVIPTGSEARDIQRQQAEFASQRAEFAQQRAEFAQQQAEFAQQQAEAAQQRAERLAEQLRALGIDPNQD
jgi:hypothetical protein